MSLVQVYLVMVNILNVIVKAAMSGKMAVARKYLMEHKVICIIVMVL